MTVQVDVDLEDTFGDFTPAEKKQAMEILIESADSQESLTLLKLVVDQCIECEISMPNVIRTVLEGRD